MYLTVNKSQKSENRTFKPVPAGTHLGRLYRVVDIGTQQGEWEGKITHQRKLIFYFELFGEDDTGAPLTKDDGRPLIITKYYNATLDQRSTFRKDLQNWLKIDFDNFEEGERFQIKDILGKYAMVSVIQQTKKNKEIKSKLESLAAVPTMIMKSGLPEGVNDIFLFDLEKFDSDKFNSLSESIRTIISASPEYRKAAQGNAPKPKTDGFEDDLNDVPF